MKEKIIDDVIYLGDDKNVLIWDLATDGLVNELKGHDSTIMNLDWSADGQFITSGDTGGTVRLWSAKIATKNGIRCVIN